MFLLAISAIILIIYIIERYSIKNALKGIEYTQEPSLRVIEPDEEFNIISVLQNRTRRFVAYLGLQEKFSKDVSLHTKNTKVSEICVLESTQYLMPKQRLERRIRASISKRGRYFLYGARIYGGDFLGITEKCMIYDYIHEVVVIPKETKIKDIGIQLSGYIGEISINRFIFEDPILTVGFNEYTGQEPQKMISWTQTARLGQLMVKRYDHTLELMATVILNIDCGRTFDEELLEECYSIARTACQYLENNNIKYRFISNAITAGLKPIWEGMEYGWGRDYLADIFEGLGRAEYDVRIPYNRLMNNVIKSAELGVGHILITPKLNKNDTQEIEKLKELTGFEVCVLTPEIGGE